VFGLHRTTAFVMQESPRAVWPDNRRLYGDGMVANGPYRPPRLWPYRRPCRRKVFKVAGPTEGARYERSRSRRVSTARSRVRGLPSVMRVRLRTCWLPLVLRHSSGT
jgi:hypothetical protein